MLPAHDRGVSREAFPGIVSVPAIIRDVLPNGLRLLTERMPHVRSVSIGVWLSRGSRHEPAAHEGIAHFVEHMLFKGTTTRSAEDIAQQIDSIGGHLDAFTSKEYAGYYIKVLDEHLPRGRRRALGSRHRSGVRPGRNRAREESRPRRDQDGRGHPRRSRPRDLRRRVLAEASARPADPRPAGDGVGARPDDPSPLLRRRLCRLELHRRGGRQPRARPGPRPRRAGIPGGARPRLGHHRHRAGDGRRRARALERPRAEPRLLRQPGAGLQRPRPLRRLRPQHHARRLDELAAVPERAREARPGLLGLLEPEQLPRLGGADHLRRLRQRVGAGSWSTWWCRRSGG